MIGYFKKHSIINKSNLDFFSYEIQYDTSIGYYFDGFNVYLYNNCIYFFYIPYLNKSYNIKILFYSNELLSTIDFVDNIDNIIKYVILDKNFLYDTSVDFTNFKLIDNKNYQKLYLSKSNSNEYVYIDNFDIYDNQISISKNQNIYNYDLACINSLVNKYNMDKNRIENILLFIKQINKQYYHPSDYTVDIIDINNINNYVIDHFSSREIAKFISYTSDTTSILIINKLPLHILNIFVNPNDYSFINSDFSVVSENLVFPYNFSNSSFDLSNLEMFENIYLSFFNSDTSSVALLKCKILDNKIKIYNNINISNYNKIIYPIIYGYAKPLIYNFNLGYNNYKDSNNIAILYKIFISYN